MSYSYHDLMPGAKSCIDHYALPRDGDRVLIVFDDPAIADALVSALRDYNKNVRVDSYYLGKPLRPATLTAGLSKLLADSTIVFTIFESRADEEFFRGELLEFSPGKESRRIFHMPGVTPETFTGSGALGLTDPEIEEMIEVTKELAIALTLTQTAQISSELYQQTNLNLTFATQGHVATISTGHVMNGSWGNLPSGEAFVLPAKAAGVIIIDKAVSEIPPGFDPIKLTFVDNRAQKLVGGPLADKIRAAEHQAKLEGRPIEAVRQICEFGIGTNPKALAHNFIEEEKILGTIHVAIGGNTFLGGKIYAPNHIDMVMSRPVVVLDGKYTILAEGQIVRSVVQDIPKVDHDAFDSSGISNGHTLEIFPEATKKEGVYLHRQWKDGRGKEFSVQIGTAETSKLALDIWELCEAHRQMDVAALRKVFAKKHGSPPNPDTVPQVLQVLKRFKVLSLDDPKNKGDATV
jgi:hypothetical protein